jgi:hypothetical protein
MVCPFNFNFLKPCLFLVLENPNLCQLADEETPTSTSGNLGTSGNDVLGEEDEEAENYNDISSENILKFSMFIK